MEQVVVGMAECGAGDVRGQVLTTFALGSCVGLTTHDPLATVGGLLTLDVCGQSDSPAARGGVQPGLGVGRGAVSRNLRLEIGTGRVWLWEGGMCRYVGDAKNPCADRR